MTNSNMAPGSEDDPRSGIYDDGIFCPDCIGSECHYCDGEGLVSERHYNDLRAIEKEEIEANL